MKNTITLNEKFYQKLGSLFYAVASADRSVEVEEINELKELVRKEWKDLEDSTDKFGSDSAFQIEVVFDFLLSQNIKSEVAFAEFKSYKDANPRFFDNEMNDLIYRTARAITAAFSSVNKSELVILEKLKMLLS